MEQFCLLHTTLFGQSSVMMTGISSLLSMMAEVPVAVESLEGGSVPVRFVVVAFTITTEAGNHHVSCLQDLHEDLCSVFTSVHVATLPLKLVRLIWWVVPAHLAVKILLGLPN